MGRLDGEIRFFVTKNAVLATVTNASVPDQKIRLEPFAVDRGPLKQSFQLRSADILATRFTCALAASGET